MNIVDLAEELIADARASIRYELEQSIPSEYRTGEIRTVGLLLPRRSGKTTAAKILHSRHSSLLLGVAHRNWPYNISTTFLGRNSQDLSGLKYNLIILDDYRSKPDELYKGINSLLLSDMLTKDYIILKLETPWN